MTASSSLQINVFFSAFTSLLRITGSHIYGRALCLTIGDIFYFTDETWLDYSTINAEIKLPGFVCIRQDRTGNKEGHGGVAIYVREDLAFHLRSDINTGG